MHSGSPALDAGYSPPPAVSASTARKTVLHLIETGGPGGAETVMVRLIEGLDREGWHSVAVVPWEGWLLGALREAGVETHVIPSSGSFDWRWLFQLRRLARDIGADIIQTHLFGAGVYGSIVGHLTGLPVIVTIHGEVDFSLDARGIQAKIAVLRRQRTRLVAVSSSIQQKLMREFRLPAERIRLIPNGIDVDTFALAQPSGLRREMGWGADDVVVGAVGNIRGPKDYANLLDAAALVSSRHPRCRFAIIGDTEGEPHLYASLIERLERLNVRDRVAFLGFRADVPSVLKDFDVYVMSSSREGLPLALLQAMASGRPIVATRCGGPEEVLRDGQSGMLVAPGNPAELAEALSKVIEAPALARELGTRAHETVCASYGRKAMIEGYESLYLEALSRRTG